MCPPVGLILVMLHHDGMKSLTSSLRRYAGLIVTRIAPIKYQMSLHTLRKQLYQCLHRPIEERHMRFDRLYIQYSNERINERTCCSPSLHPLDRPALRLCSKDLEQAR